ncbi:MAG TPA: type II toxin-antitoxin system VapC family toxin [Thermoleophilaceae bacterium]|nr:type II toxin-antitoxin system VapC family toxin [Thermoleophilaceae bacterium]
MSGIAYLDASALVKLIVAEPESAVLAETIRAEWPYALASEIVTVECHRAALRVGGDAPRIAASRLGTVALLDVTPAIRKGAQRLGPPELRTLDAIHLATAESVSEQIGAVLTYDTRLADAARAVGLPVQAPA